MKMMKSPTASSRRARLTTTTSAAGSTPLRSAFPRRIVDGGDERLGCRLDGVDIDRRRLRPQQPAAAE